jgi:hypothetical protein
VVRQGNGNGQGFAAHGDGARGHQRGASFRSRRVQGGRIYVTLAGDGKTANFKFMPDEQEFKCMILPDAFTPVPNAWGRQGWTTATLSALSKADLQSALEMAWQHASAKKRRR